MITVNATGNSGIATFGGTIIRTDLYSNVDLLEFNITFGNSTGNPWGSDMIIVSFQGQMLARHS